MTLYICFWLAVFGGCIGSFLNVVIYRLPRRSFLSKARSFCPSCGATLRWRDLIPVVSWLMLRGRCRVCRAKISPRYPLTELFCAALAPLCFLRFGFSWMALITFGVVTVLMAVTQIDFATMEIPNGLVAALVPFAAGAVWAVPGVPLWERLAGFFAVSLPMLLLALAVNGAFGGGDIKLMAVCGFLLGYKMTLLGFFIALLAGGGAAVFLLLTKRKTRGASIPFGPALCLGVAAALFFGGELLSLYMRLYR
ncbi:MAG: prepilin peptidase [Oscillospiraceae bacterium]|jgi:leader peptidase (prepilin peptidase)/N-methyltransferase|nr:prepilin peptidase [Oscillospiraceae bacterium]